MKLREFWIDYSSRFLPMTAYDKPGLCGSDPDSIHVREVSPELDAAYEECEMALRNLSYESYSKTPPFKPDCACHSVADKALASLKKANKKI